MRRLRLTVACCGILAGGCHEHAVPVAARTLPIEFERVVELRRTAAATQPAHYFLEAQRSYAYDQEAQELMLGLLTVVAIISNAPPPKPN